MSPEVAHHTPDRIDRAIVSRLQVDGRLPNVELAAGIIAGYRAEVDRVRAGLGLTVFIELKVEGHSRETSAQLEAALTAIPAVVACYLISGSADFFIEAAVPDLAVYEQVLLDQILAIPQVVSAQSTFAIRTVMNRGPLPLDHWK